jgi:hypothetical protein
LYEGKIVSMFFKKGGSFPYRMILSDNKEAYTGFFSEYSEVRQTYHLTISSGEDYYVMDNLRLNKEIFLVYKNDPDLSPSQNLRMKNMTVAMGVWASLYVHYDISPVLTPVSRATFSRPRDFIKSWFVFVGVIAAVVACIEVPPLALAVPASLPAAVTTAAGYVAGAAALGVLVLEGLVLLDKPDSPQNEPPPGETGIPHVPAATITLPKVGNRPIIYNYNNTGVHEDFHVEPGAELLVDFYFPGANFEVLTTQHFIPNYGNIMFTYEPWADNEPDYKDREVNLVFFTNPPVTLVSKSKEEFRGRIKRTLVNSSIGDGKIQFGFFLFSDPNYEFSVNDWEGGFLFRKMKIDEEAKLYKNAMVIYLCIDKDCPDLKR